MHGQIALAVVETNDALARSLVPHRFRLAHSALTPYQESGTPTDQNRLIAAADGFMDEVPILRNSVQADLVVLVIEQRAYPQGIATLMYNQDYAESEIQTSVSDRELLTWVVPHEFGTTLARCMTTTRRPAPSRRSHTRSATAFPGSSRPSWRIRTAASPARDSYDSNPAVSYRHRDGRRQLRRGAGHRRVAGVSLEHRPTFVAHHVHVSAERYWQCPGDVPIPPNAAISPLWNSFNVYVGANFVGQAAIVQDGSACGGARRWRLDRWNLPPEAAPQPWP